MIEIKSAGIIGAGVMGGAIAAHFANAGVPVLLLDIVPEGAKNRNAIAEGTVEKLLRTDPAAFMHKKAAKLVQPGNIEDHLDLLAGVDWILEAVVEDFNAKRTLYRRIENIRREGSVVSSNTSTLPLSKLIEGLPERFRREFLITHFFNPPRYMRLLELVGGPDTRAEVVLAIREFADRRLGKSVVNCHDAPGFIANRIGAFWLQCAVREALDRGLHVEEADALMSHCLGVPKTGVFGLLDLVGLDLMLKIDTSLQETLPAEDPYFRIRRDFPLLRRMVQQGYTGRKGKGGFYRLKSHNGNKAMEAIDLSTGEYRPAARADLERLEANGNGGLRALVEFPDKGGRYSWAVLSETLAYAASVAPQVADDIHAIDRAMNLGFHWKDGPFELMDRMGPGYLADRLRENGRNVPDLLHKASERGGFYKSEDGRPQYLTFQGQYDDVPHAEGILNLSDIKAAEKPIAANSSASLWDIGDGAACLEVHTKMNTLDPNVFIMIRTALETVQKDYRALVIYNEGPHFSAGVNLGLALFSANVAAWPMIEELIRQGQEVYQALKYSPLPVVGAPSGLAIGGGCEMLLHCDAVQAHAESYIGLVESSVGVVPAWGGCKELLIRLSAAPKRPGGSVPAVVAAFETIGLARVSRSAYEAKEMGFLRAGDQITFNRDRLLADAKAKALELAKDYRAPAPAELILPGPSGKAALRMMVENLAAKGDLTPHDRVVAEALAGVLTGGQEADPTVPVREDEILVLERAAFMKLCRTKETLARIEHTLETGKPLRN